MNAYPFLIIGALTVFNVVVSIQSFKLVRQARRMVREVDDALHRHPVVHDLDDEDRD